MAKDNVPFHTVSFPVTLIGSREPWKRADQIKGFNWLTYYGGKFSTSQGRGVFMDQALDTFPADYWRWYLFANAPESSDASFTWDGFTVAVNKDLADSFGNLVNRCLTLSAKHYGPVVPAGGAPGEREQQLEAELGGGRPRPTPTLMAAKELRKSANELRRGWALANAYWEQSEPWKVVKADPDAAAVIFRTVINVVRVLAVLASPIIPTSSDTVLDRPRGDRPPRGRAATPSPTSSTALAPGHPVAVPAGALRQGHRRAEGGARGPLRRPRQPSPALPAPAAAAAPAPADGTPATATAARRGRGGRRRRRVRRASGPCARSRARPRRG